MAYSTNTSARTRASQYFQLTECATCYEDFLSPWGAYFWICRHRKTCLTCFLEQMNSVHTKNCCPLCREPQTRPRELYSWREIVICVEFLKRGRGSLPLSIIDQVVVWDVLNREPAVNDNDADDDNDDDDDDRFLTETESDTDTEPYYDIYRLSPLTSRPTSPLSPSPQSTTPPAPLALPSPHIFEEE